MRKVILEPSPAEAHAWFWKRLVVKSGRGLPEEYITSRSGGSAWSSCDLPSGSEDRFANRTHPEPRVRTRGQNLLAFCVVACGTEQALFAIKLVAAPLDSWLPARFCCRRGLRCLFGQSRDLLKEFVDALFVG